MSDFLICFLYYLGLITQACAAVVLITFLIAQRNARYERIHLHGVWLYVMLIALTILLFGSVGSAAYQMHFEQMPSVWVVLRTCAGSGLLWGIIGSHWRNVKAFGWEGSASQHIYHKCCRLF